MRIHPLTAALVGLFLAGCETAPLSYINGQSPSTLVPPNLYPVRVVSVDGTIQFRMPVQLSAGPHSLVLEAAPGLGANRKQRTYAFKVDPCTRYFLMAQRAEAGTGWDLVVHSKETVPACNPEEELKKGAQSSALR